MDPILAPDLATLTVSAQSLMNLVANLMSLRPAGMERVPLATETEALIDCCPKAA